MTRICTVCEHQQRDLIERALAEGRSLRKIARKFNAEWHARCANLAMAMAGSVTIVNRIEYAVFVILFFLTGVPLLPGAVAAHLKWWAPAAKHLKAHGDLS
jgi:hypothetical protein